MYLVRLTTDPPARSSVKRVHSVVRVLVALTERMRCSIHLFVTIRCLSTRVLVVFIYQSNAVLLTALKCPKREVFFVT